MIKDRPDPWDPNAFHSIHRKPIHQEQRTGNIEHPRSIGNAQDPPRDSVPTKEIIIHILGSSSRDIESDKNSGRQIDQDDSDINNMKIHVE